MQLIREKGEIEYKIEAYKKKIEKLETELDCELEWKPYEDTNHVRQNCYLELANAHDTKRLTDEEAKELFYDWYGFAKEKVTIVHHVPRYEKNRHNYLRVIGQIERPPLYNATDWNYIRFDCGCMSYELYNDSFRLFRH